MDEKERQLNLFSDDLFKYLFPRRINIEIGPWLERRGDSISLFHPFIGMAVLCESSRSQKGFLEYFVENFANLDDRKSYFRFCASYSFDLYEKNKDDIFKSFITIASMTLELGVYCHLRGYQNFKYYSGSSFSTIVQFCLANEFFEKGGFRELKRYAADDAMIYIGSNVEVQVSSRVEYRTEWLTTFDFWPAGYNPLANFPGTPTTSESHDTDDGTSVSKNKSDAVKHSQTSVDAENEALISEDKDITVAKITPTEEKSSESHDTETSASKDKSVFAEHREKASFDAKDEARFSEEQEMPDERRDVNRKEDSVSNQMEKNPNIEKIEPDSTPIKPVSPITFLLLKEKMARNKDSAYEEVLNILSSESNVDVLMGEDLFIHVRKMVCTGMMRMENIDILQIVKLLLSRNDMALTCYGAIEYVDKCRKSTHTASKSSDGPECPNVESLEEKFSRMKSLQLGAIPKVVKGKSTGSISPCVEDKKLLRKFNRVVSRSSDSFGPEIYKLLQSKDNAEILLGDIVFREIMTLTVYQPNDRWGNEWLLSLTKSLIDALKPSRQTSSPKDQATDVSSGQTSTNLTSKAVKFRSTPSRVAGNSASTSKSSSTTDTSRIPTVTSSASRSEDNKLVSKTVISASNKPESHPDSAYDQAMAQMMSGLRLEIEGIKSAAVEFLKNEEQQSSACASNDYPELESPSESVSELNDEVNDLIQRMSRLDQVYYSYMKGETEQEPRHSQNFTTAESSSSRSTKRKASVGGQMKTDPVGRKETEDKNMPPSEISINKKTKTQKRRERRERNSSKQNKSSEIKIAVPDLPETNTVPVTEQTIQENSDTTGIEDEKLEIEHKSVSELCSKNDSLITRRTAKSAEELTVEVSEPTVSRESDLTENKHPADKGADRPLTDIAAEELPVEINEPTVSIESDLTENKHPADEGTDGQLTDGSLNESIDDSRFSSSPRCSISYETSQLEESTRVSTVLPSRAASDSSISESTNVTGISGINLAAYSDDPDSFGLKKEIFSIFEKIYDVEVSRLNREKDSSTYPKSDPPIAKSPCQQSTEQRPSDERQMKKAVPVMANEEDTIMGPSETGKQESESSSVKSVVPELSEANTNPVIEQTIKTYSDAEEICLEKPEVEYESLCEMYSANDSSIIAREINKSADDLIDEKNEPIMPKSGFISENESVTQERKNEPVDSSSVLVPIKSSIEAMKSESGLIPRIQKVQGKDSTNVSDEQSLLETLSIHKVIECMNQQLRIIEEMSKFLKDHKISTSDSKNQTCLEEQIEQVGESSSVKYAEFSMSKASIHNVKDENKVQHENHGDSLARSASQSDCITYPEKADSSSQMEEPEKHSPIKARNISPEILLAYKNALNLVPKEMSDSASDSVPQQIIENHPDLLEAMKKKLVMDEEIRKELMNILKGLTLP